MTLVVFHGSFVDTLAKVPRYAAAPSGSVLAYAVSETGSVIETYVGDHGPPSSLGEPAYQPAFLPKLRQHARGRRGSRTAVCVRKQRRGGTNVAPAKAITATR